MAVHFRRIEAFKQVGRDVLASVKYFYRHEKLLFCCLAAVASINCASLTLAFLTRTKEEHFSVPMLPPHYLKIEIIAPPPKELSKTKDKVKQAAVELPENTGETAKKPDAANLAQAAASKEKSNPKTIQDFIKKELSVKPVENTRAETKVFQAKYDKELKILSDLVARMRRGEAVQFNAVEDLLPLQYAAQHLQKTSYLMPALNEAEMFEIFKSDLKAFGTIAKDKKLTKTEKLRKLIELVAAKAPYDPGASLLTSIFGLGQDCKVSTMYEMGIAAYYAEDLLEDGEEFVLAKYKGHLDSGIYNRGSKEVKLFDANKQYPVALEPTKNFVPNLVDPRVLAESVLRRLTNDHSPIDPRYIIARGNMVGNRPGKGIEIKGSESPLDFSIPLESDYSYEEGDDDNPTPLERHERPDWVEFMVNFPEIHEKYPDAAIAEAVLEKLGREARQPGAGLDDVVNWVPHTAIVSLLEFVASNPEMQKKWGAVSHDDFSSLLWRVNEYYRFSTARAKGLVSPEGEAQSIFYFGPSGYSPKRISLTDSPARRLSPDTVLFDTDFFVRALMEQMNGSPYADFDVLRYFSNFDESSARKLTKILASVLGKIGSRGYFFATPTKLLQRIDSLQKLYASALPEARNLALIALYSACAQAQAILNSEEPGKREQYRKALAVLSEHPLIAEARSAFWKLKVRPDFVPEEYEYKPSAIHPTVDQVYKRGQFLGYSLSPSHGVFSPAYGRSGELLGYKSGYSDFYFTEQNGRLEQTDIDRSKVLYRGMELVPVWEDVKEQNGQLEENKLVGFAPLSPVTFDVLPVITLQKASLSGAEVLVRQNGINHGYCQPGESNVWREILNETGRVLGYQLSGSKTGYASIVESELVMHPDFDMQKYPGYSYGNEVYLTYEPEKNPGESRKIFGAIERETIDRAPYYSFERVANSNQSNLVVVNKDRQNIGYYSESSPPFDEVFDNAQRVIGYTFTAQQRNGKRYYPGDLPSRFYVISADGELEDRSSNIPSGCFVNTSVQAIFIYEKLETNVRADGLSFQAPAGRIVDVFSKHID